MNIVKKLNNIAITKLNNNEYNEALSIYKKILKLEPDHIDSIININIISYLKGEKVKSKSNLLELEKKTNNINLYINIGFIFHAENNLDKALIYYKKAEKIDSSNQLVISNILNLLVEFGKIDIAKEYIKKAEIVKNKSIDLLNNMGTVYFQNKEIINAIKYYTEALNITINVNSLNNLAMCFEMLGKFDIAILTYREAIKVKPNNIITLRNLSNCYFKYGDVEEAIKISEYIIKKHGADFETFVNNMLYKIYSCNITPEKLKISAEICANEFRSRSKKNYKIYEFKLGKNEINKIGFISGDFNTHPIGYHIISIIENLHKDGYGVYCYYNGINKDNITEKYINSSTEFKLIKNLTDTELAEEIYNDKIDILIDLSGYTNGSRLPVFIHRPAALQITYLGYPGTTGFKEIDYRITDSIADPVGAEIYYTEKLYRLRNIYSCYTPKKSNIELTKISPYIKNGFITYGCINNNSKINDNVIKLWVEILYKNPNSKLLLEITAESNLENAHQSVKKLLNMGVDRSRLILHKRKPENQYYLYNEIDICLDPFPCNGGTSSFDALWMSVPIVTLAGNRFSSRMGTTLLYNLNLKELVASTTKEYINIATDLGRNKEVLNHYRKNIRKIMINSDLMNEKKLYKEFVSGLKEMWKYK